MRPCRPKHAQERGGILRKRCNQLFSPIATNQIWYCSCRLTQVKTLADRHFTPAIHVAAGVRRKPEKSRTPLLSRFEEKTARRMHLFVFQVRYYKKKDAFAWKASGRKFPRFF